MFNHMKSILSGVVLTLALVLLIPTLEAEAAGPRSGNIKSKGVFQSLSPLNEEVYLDAGDIISLAEQVDDLQDLYEQKLIDEYNRGYTNGYSKATGSARISYVYHQHVNGTGAVVTANTVYSTSNPGGCYVAAGHTHDATGTCGYHKVYAIPLGEHNSCEHHGSGNRCAWVKCSECGRVLDHFHVPKRDFADFLEGKLILEMDYCHHSSYTCGSPTNTWVLGCGKTTSTVIRATITYYDN